MLARFKRDGNLDQSFGDHGFAVIKALKDIEPTVIVAQRDDDLLVAASSSGSPSRSAVVRLLPNGRLDPSFGKGGTVSLDDKAHALGVQADGKVLAGGVRGDSLTLSRFIGGHNCVVPDLRGKTVPKASRALKSSYCRKRLLFGGVGIVEEPHDLEHVGDIAFVCE